MKENHFITAVVSVLIAVIGLATIAVLVSSGAQTGNVATAGGTSFANIIKCALAPVTGGSCPSSGGILGSLTPNVNSTINYG